MSVIKHVEPRELYYVIHPLDDVPEQKCDTESLGLMPMSLPARISLGALRCYLVLMGMMVLYHVLDLAGLFGK
jgi:hypothetical protein